MTIALPPAPGAYNQRIDKSGFTYGGSAQAHATAGYSLRGPVNKPVLLTTVSQCDAVIGRPNAAVSYAHYGIRFLIRKGFPVYFQRVTNNAAYGGSVVLSNAASSGVRASAYPVGGSPFSADPDPTTGIAPNGPGYTSIVFNGPLVTSNVINLN